MPTKKTPARSPQSLIEARITIERLERENALMLEEIRLLRAKRFGPTSEKSVYISGQLMLFNEAEYLSRKEVAEAAYEVVIRREKRSGKREADLAGLPVRRIDYELSEDERICPECRGPLHEMDVDIRRELEYIPPRLPS